MKKSFKKAGAAVLSMSMLLAMGAVSMPVYALPDHETVVPAQLAVTIAKDNGLGEKHADDANHKYDYLEDVNTASVTVYRVATLGTNGWQWETNIKSALENTTNETEVISDFEELLEKISNDSDIPAASSDELQSLAAKLERIVTAAGFSGAVNVGSGVVKKEGNGFTTAYIPQDSSLFDGETQNKIGYYLISTTTDDAGVVLQPALVVLRNKVTTGEASDTSYVKSVSLKGNAISVDKSIEDIATYVDADDKKKVNDTAAEGDKTYVSRADIAGSKDSGVIDADDIISYQIAVDVPQYDKKLGKDKIEDFLITDTPDKGINVIGRIDTSSTPNTFADVQATSGTALNDRIEVYYSIDDELIKTSEGAAENAVVDIKLKENIDYKIETNEGANQGKGFKIKIDAEQLRGLTGTNLNTNSALYHAATPASGTEGQEGYVPAVPAYCTSMEGGKIFVVFKAQTTEDFNTKYEELEELTPDATVDSTGVTLDAIAEKLAEVKALRTSNPNDFATYVKNISTADLTKVKGKTGYNSVADATYTAMMTALTGTGGALEGMTEAQQEEYIKAATYAVIKGLQTAIDVENADKKDRNAAKKNGNKNIATVQYDNKFNGEGQYKTIKDETKLYSVNLDLTKVALDNKIIDRPVYVSSVTAATDTVEASRLKVGEKYVMLKKGSTLLTTTEASEADAEPKYVSVITPAANKAAAVQENGQYVYVKANDKETTLNTSEAKTVEGKYSDDFEHTPVLGAIFELREVYASNVAAAGQRVQGVSGKHSRGLAMTNSQGKLMLLEADDPTTTVPPLATIIAPATDYAVNDVVYYTTIDDNGTTKYVPYKYTNKAAWEKLGEGTYELEEIEAPSGYKQWKGVSTFTITAENDGATGLSDSNANFTGEFNGASTSSGFLNGNVAAKDDAPATFTFENAATGNKGALKNEILNEFDDTLPATGGMGTVLFTAGGISIVLIAGALFVMYMKKRNAEDEE